MSTHWGRVTHICVGKLTIIGSDNGLSPGRRQAIIWTSAGILLIEPLGTNFSEILIGIQIFSFTKMRLKMSSAKWRPLCLGLNVLINIVHRNIHVSPGLNMLKFQQKWWTLWAKILSGANILNIWCEIWCHAICVTSLQPKNAPLSKFKHYFPLFVFGPLNLMLHWASKNISYLFFRKRLSM